MHNQAGEERVRNIPTLGISKQNAEFFFFFSFNLLYFFSFLNT